MQSPSKAEVLRSSLEQLYAKHAEALLFHGWHHISFVSKKAKEFAGTIGADPFISESAGLVHDLNYMVDAKSDSEKGTELRSRVLMEAGYSQGEVERIELIVNEAHTGSRGKDISPEGMALSDADTLFKALPVTPILFAGRYLQETGADISKLARSVVSKQEPLFEQGIYFYTDAAKGKYMKWARTNLNLWKNVEEALQDPDVQEMLKIAGR